METQGVVKTVINKTVSTFIGKLDSITVTAPSRMANIERYSQNNEEIKKKKLIKQQKRKKIDQSLKRNDYSNNEL